MRHHAFDRLNPILKGVSRSFYLSLRILPSSLRRPIGLAYLLARAADTIADTTLIDTRERLAHLERFRGLFEAYDPRYVAAIREALVGPQHLAAERQLLLSLEQCFDAYQACAAADRARVGRLLTTLTQGMIVDLTAFPREHGAQVRALKSRADLEQYTYYVAGCVGEFWTDMHVAHRPALAEWDLQAMRGLGIRFGKGLQLTNILRDLARDLRLGRCYLPLEDLTPHGLQPQALLDPAAIVKVRPVLQDFLALTTDHYRQGWAYTLAIPRREVRMRLACAWPLCIGLRTLDLVAKADNLLDPAITVKIPRRAVYSILLGSGLSIPSNMGLMRYARHLGRHLPQG